MARRMAPRTGIALLAFAGALACGEIAAQLVGAGRDASPMGVLGATLAAHTGFGLLAVAGVCFVPGGDPVARLGLQRGRLPLAGTAWAIVGTVALSHALHRMLALLAMRERGALARVDQVVESASQAPAGLLLALGAVAVAAPVVEEILFRGLLLRGLRRLGAVAAVAISAAAFGLFHMDAIQGGAAALLGLYLGTVAWRAGSVRPAIGCHLANNVFGVVTAGLGLGGATPAGTWIALPLLGLAALGLWRVAQATGDPPVPTPRSAVEAAPPEG